MRNLIAVINDYDEETEFRKTCIDSLKRYAEEMGCDFEEFKTEKVVFKEETPHWKKLTLIEEFAVGERYAKYDKLLYLDIDIFYNENCMDGNTIPEENNIFHWFDRRGAEFMSAQDFYMEEEWIKEFEEDMLDTYQVEKPSFFTYFNSGVLIMDRSGAQKLTNTIQKYKPCWPLSCSNFEQGYLNFATIKSVEEEGLKYTPLSNIWNMMQLAEGCCNLGIFNHFAAPEGDRLGGFMEKWKNVL